MINKIFFVLILASFDLQAMETQIAELKKTRDNQVTSQFNFNKVCSVQLTFGNAFDALPDPKRDHIFLVENDSNVLILDHDLKTVDVFALNNGVGALLLLSDGDRLCASNGHTSIIWDLNSNESLQTLDIPSSTYLGSMGLAELPHKKQIVFNYSDENDISYIAFWDLASNTKIAQQPLDGGFALFINTFIVNDSVIAGSWDDCIRWFDDNGNCKYTAQNCNTQSMLINGQDIVSASDENNEIIGLDVADPSNKNKQKLFKAANFIGTIANAHDNTKIIGGGSSGGKELTVWDYNTQNLITKWIAPDAPDIIEPTVNNLVLTAPSNMHYAQTSSNFQLWDLQGNLVAQDKEVMPINLLTMITEDLFLIVVGSDSNPGIKTVSLWQIDGTLKSKTENMRLKKSAVNHTALQVLQKKRLDKKQNPQKMQNPQQENTRYKCDVM